MGCLSLVRPLANCIQTVDWVEHELADELLTESTLLIFILLGECNDELLLNASLLETDEIFGQRHLIYPHEVTGACLRTAANLLEFFTGNGLYMGLLPCRPLTAQLIIVLALHFHAYFR